MTMLEILNHVISNKTLQKLTLSKCVDKGILRTTGRLTMIKGSVYLSLESFHSDGKATQVNIPVNEAVVIFNCLY